MVLCYESGKGPIPGIRLDLQKVENLKIEAFGSKSMISKTVEPADESPRPEYSLLTKRQISEGSRVTNNKIILSQVLRIDLEGNFSRQRKRNSCSKGRNRRTKKCESQVIESISRSY